MRFYGLILTIAIAALPGAALANDARLEASLHDLDSATRLIQVCDLAVMDKMSGKEGVADRAFIDALHRPEVHGDVAKGDDDAAHQHASIGAEKAIGDQTAQDRGAPDASSVGAVD